jgi:hypothetical protein
MMVRDMVRNALPFVVPDKRYCIRSFVGVTCAPFAPCERSFDHRLVMKFNFDIAKRHALRPSGHGLYALALSPRIGDEAGPID